MISEIFRTYVAGLLSPTAFVALALVTGLTLLFKNKTKSAKVVLLIGTISFLVISTAPLRYFLFNALETSPMEIPRDYRFVVVLGGRIFPNEAHPTSSQITPGLLSRLAYGVALTQKNPDSKLVVTGNGAGEIPEAFLMEKFALEMGLPKERVIREAESMNTKDHPKYLAPILGKEKFLIVTSAYHMERALHNFRAHGLEGIAAPTDYMNKKKNGLDAESLIPRGENFSAMDKWMTEFYSTLWTHTRKLINL